MLNEIPSKDGNFILEFDQEKDYWSFKKDESLNYKLNDLTEFVEFMDVLIPYIKANLLKPEVPKKKVINLFSNEPIENKKESIVEPSDPQTVEVTPEQLAKAKEIREKQLAVQKAIDDRDKQAVINALNQQTQIMRTGLQGIVAMSGSDQTDTATVSREQRVFK